MVKNVLQIIKLVVLKLKLDKLCGSRSLEVRARGELVGQPELSIGHGDEEGEDEIDRRIQWELQWSVKLVIGVYIPQS